MVSPPTETSTPRAGTVGTGSTGIPAPTFLVLGAPKCGTTSVCHLLDQHSDVFVPENKEPIFFDVEYDRGLEYYKQKYFSKWSGQPALGEGRPFKLFLPYVPARIKEALPGAKLIAMLRNPVERAYSHWWHRHSRRTDSLSFGEAIEANLRQRESGVDFEGEAGVRRWRENITRVGERESVYRVYLECGLYAEQIRRYRALFPPEQLRVYLYEDLRADAEGLIRELRGFLGVSDDAPLEDLSPQNVARRSRPGGLEYQVRRLAERSGLLPLIPRGLKDAVAGLFRPQPIARPAMQLTDRDRLLDFYREPNRDIEELLGRDLSAWNRPRI